MKRKKAQIKMGETMAILVIFFFLLVIGLSFYVKVQQFTFDRQTRGVQEMKAIQVAQKSAFMPELQCSFKNIPVDNCYDQLKITYFNEALSDDRIRLKYGDIFGLATLEVEQIYPEPSGGGKYLIYNNTDTSRTYERRTAQIPISLYDARERTYSFAILRVDIYD